MRYGKSPGEFSFWEAKKETGTPKGSHDDNPKKTNGGIFVPTEQNGRHNNPNSRSFILHHVFREVKEGYNTFG
jgi:hypothetical protein